MQLAVCRRSWNYSSTFSQQSGQSEHTQSTFDGKQWDIHIWGGKREARTYTLCRAVPAQKIHTIAVFSTEPTSIERSKGDLPYGLRKGAERTAVDRVDLEFLNNKEPRRSHLNPATLLSSLKKGSLPKERLYAHEIFRWNIWSFQKILTDWLEYYYTCAILQLYTTLQQ